MIAMALAILIAGGGVGAVLGILGIVRWREWQIAYAMSEGGGTFKWLGMTITVTQEGEE